VSDISTIRSLIGDPLQRAKETFGGDGAETEFQVGYAPVISNTQRVTINGTLKIEGSDYTFDDDTGVATFAAAPANATTVIITYKFYLLTDAQLQGFLDLEGDVKLAAADALDSIASTQALIQKKIKLLDMQTDGPSLAEALHKLAEAYREQVFSPDREIPDFEIVERIEPTDRPAIFEKVLKDFMRLG
jgi:hypothetical protein